MRRTSVVSTALLATALFVAGSADGFRTGAGSDPASDPPVAAEESGASQDVDARSRYSRRFGISVELADVVVRQARRARVDPEIVFALIAVESGFDPRAVGSSGERGLMQIKPATARAYESGITPEGLLVPEVNLRIGLEHLKREVEHFGDWSLGLTAYNMGRSRLREILASTHRPPRAYAARVLAGCDGDCS